MSVKRDPLKAARDREAAEWCIALGQNDLTPGDWQRFDLWIAMPENARALDEAVQIWNSADDAAETPEIIQLRTASLDAFGRASRARWSPARSRYRIAGAIAAVLLVLIASGYWFLRDPAEVFRTGIGERRIAMLADGSRLSLDADTQVDVRLEGARRRLTLLRGRAKFDVAKDPMHPFVVTAGDKMVVATGTSFSVELLRSDVRVLLYEGHVAVLKRDSQGKDDLQPVRSGPTLATAEKLLRPGDELIASIGSAEPATLRLRSEAPAPVWEGGQLSFDDEPLATAIVRVNRYSSERIELGSAAVGERRINGVFAAGDTAAFLEGLAVLDGVSAQRRNGVIILQAK